jgi:dTDP-4-dehydrorhamnose reductase
MKVLVVGGSGMLGHKLVQVLQNRFDVWTTLRSEFSHYESLKLFNSEKIFDLTDACDFIKFEEILKTLKPDVVVNAIGVIKQLPTSKDVINTLTINSIFPQKLAQAAQRLNFRLIVISTDCVFNGEKGNYTEKDIPNAEDLYGKSKNLGEVIENNCLTLRTSIIGREIETSHSLIEWFISNRGGKVKGFKKAVYSGFPTIILADIIGNIIESFPDLQGLYHLSGEPINKFDLLNLVNDAYQLEIDIEMDEDFKIDRSLDSSRLREEIGFEPQTWEDMIRIMAEDSTPYDFWRNQISFRKVKD